MRTTDASPVRSWRRAALRISGSALILTLLFLFLPLAELATAMRRIPPAGWAGSVAAYLVLHLLGVLKWRMMVNLPGAALSFPQAVRCYYAGLFGNMFLPSLVGGDIVRAGLALSFVRSKAGLVLGSLLDRLLDVAGLAVVAATGALLLPGALDPQSRRVFWILAAIVAVSGAVAIIALAVLPPRRFSYRRRRQMVQLRTALRAMASKPGYVLLALLYGIALQSLLILLNAALGNAIGLKVALQVWFFAWPLAKLSSLLPVTQGGIGVREAALVALLAPFGVPAVLTVASGLAFEVVILSGGLLGGIIAFMLGRSEAGSRSRPAKGVAKNAVAVPRA
ncbi:MAG: YbhN family protein [Gemmatimonadaceae bacterium]